MISEAQQLLRRIDAALDAAEAVFEKHDPGRIEASLKDGGDPVTAADLELDEALRSSLLGPGEGWLSEETADDLSRIDRELTWVVDPLDGTREFVEGLPEFCASVAAVVDGHPVAGGVLNPAANLRITGCEGVGVRCNGNEAGLSNSIDKLEDATVLASRSEWRRGQWSHVEDGGVRVKPMGSVAFKMARVAAGLETTTWTAVPKHEWDVAGGAALVLAAGGSVLGLEGQPLSFNQPDPWLSGAVVMTPATSPHEERIWDLVRSTPQS